MLRLAYHKALFCIKLAVLRHKILPHLVVVSRKTSSTNYSNLQSLVEQCPMQTALGQIGGRWKVLILWYVHLGSNRYSDLLRHLPNITRKMLTQQLQELVADGLLQRDIPPGQPSNRPVYVLATPAVALLPVLRELNAWGKSRQQHV